MSSNSFKNYLEESEVIDFSNPSIQKLASSLALNCNSDEEIAKKCFEYVRDEISHSGDIKADIITSKASEVLEYKTGWCYAKAFLLAALLRANGIPTAFCYQRLSCSEYKDDIYCLHGLNAIYLEKYGWYRVDPRGNKDKVDAQFIPPLEQLAFKIQKNEFDLPIKYSKPLEIIINTLEKYNNYEEISNHLPDINEYIRAVSIDDVEDLSFLSNSLLGFIFDKSAPKWFIDELSSKAFEERIINKAYEQFVYVIDKKIVGLLTIKTKTKSFIFLLIQNIIKKV